MPEHFLLQNTFKLPNEAILRSTQLSEGSMYLTKTAAAPGDDDDHDSPMNITSGWNNSFLTKTKAAPGDDDDYHSPMNIISGWDNSFLTKTFAAPGDDDDYSGISLEWGPWESLFF